MKQANINSNINKITNEMNLERTLLHLSLLRTQHRTENGIKKIKSDRNSNIVIIKTSTVTCQAFRLCPPPRPRQPNNIDNSNSNLRAHLIRPITNVAEALTTFDALWSEMVEVIVVSAAVLTIKLSATMTTTKMNIVINHWCTSNFSNSTKDQM